MSGWRNSSAGIWSRFFERLAWAGREEEREIEIEWRHALPLKMCNIPPTHFTPQGRKGKEFLADPPRSILLSSTPPLSSSHMAAVINHRIFEPLKAQCARTRAFRKTIIIGFREVSRSPLNLLDSLYLMQAACVMEKQGKEEETQNHKMLVKKKKFEKNIAKCAKAPGERPSSSRRNFYLLIYFFRFVQDSSTSGQWEYSISFFCLFSLIRAMVVVSNHRTCK